MMVTLEDISMLLDSKLAPLKEELASVKSELKSDVSSLKSDVSSLKSDVSSLKSDVSSLKSDVASVKSDVASVKDDVSRLSHTVGSLVEANMRDEARKMFGESSYAKFGGLVPSAAEKRTYAANKLARRAKSLAIPLAKAVRRSYPKKLETTVKFAEEAFDDGNYSKALGLLIAQAENGSNICLLLNRIKKAFPPAEEADDLERFLSCEGPGVMLVDLASRYTAAQLEMKDDLFDDDLHELIELDLRGTITLVKTHATVACGEVKSSWSGLNPAKKQLKRRTRFLKTVVNTVFPNTFKECVLIGHVFIQSHATEAERQIPDGGVDEGVSFYTHTVFR